ncbi:hypothetical protein [Geopseudomonas aromaticivorans]
MRAPLLSVIFLAVTLASVGAAAASKSKVDTSPSQQQPPSSQSGAAAMKAQLSNSGATSSAAVNAADNEAARIARIKQEIIDNRSKNPVLDKLGPYLGKGY